MDDITVHDVTVDAQSASITAIGPCGALISGLEDEYSDVRAAAIDSCYDISCCYDVFQSKLVEYIVSMFDDDIEHVRLQAMRTLGKIAQGRVLRDEQVLSILTELLVCRLIVSRAFQHQ
jgi:integrator complex subunit 4